MVVPRKFYIHTTSKELDQVTVFVEESMVIIKPSHIDSNHAWKIAWPLRLTKIKIVARGNDMDLLKICFVNPFLILKDVFCYSTAETAI